MAKRSAIRKRRKELLRIIFIEWSRQRELAKILGVSRRTIVRDLKAIEKDIEKEFNKRERKWKRERKKYMESL